MRVAALLLLATPAAAQEVAGFAELRGQAYGGVHGAPLTAIERLRPDFSAALSEDVVLAVTPELLLSQGRSLADEVAARFGTPPRHENDLLRIDGVSDYLSVERLYLDIYGEHLDLRLGRQAINWGSAFVVNPTDPFPEVLLTEPWRLRAGVNAARATIPIGEGHQAQVVLASDDAFTELRAAARGTLNVLESDLSLVAAWRGEDGLVGLDLRGTLGVGFWLEAALHLGERLAEELAVGIDYSFPVLERLVLTAQYYRNGRTTSGDVLSRLSRPEAFAPVFTGRDYLMASAMLGVGPELSAATLWVIDLADGSALSVTTLNLLFGGRWEAALSVQQPITRSGAIRAELLGLIPITTVTAWGRFSF